VPSLTELRRRAGVAEPGFPPETVVETLLLAGKLPAERNCVLCGVATEASVCCTVDCERAYVQSGRKPWWLYLLGFVTFGWFGVVVVGASTEDDREVGKDRVFPLPLRICSACRPRLTSPTEVKAALRRVPLYHELLEKYPGATVSLPST
jgi:hypothetical protein